MCARARSRGVCVRVYAHATVHRVQCASARGMSCHSLTRVLVAPEPWHVIKPTPSNVFHDTNARPKYARGLKEQSLVERRVLVNDGPDAVGRHCTSLVTMQKLLVLDVKLVGECLPLGAVGVGFPTVVARGVVSVERPRLAQRELDVEVELKRQQAQ